MRCIWCEKETTRNDNLKSENLKYANKEHIFPEAVDGKKVLPIGLVCMDCNNKLGTTIDNKLKYSSPIFMNLYQKSSLMNGKPIGRKRKEEDEKLRKLDEIHRIKSNYSDLTIERKKSDIHEITILNFSVAKEENEYNYWLSLGVHKCAFNAVLNIKGYDYTYSDHLELRDFILEGTKKEMINENFGNCSYAICYADDTSFVRFEPFYFPITNGEKNIIFAMLLFFPTAIFIVGLKPNVLNAISLQEIINILPDFSNSFQIKGFDFKSHFKKTFIFGDLSKKSFVSSSNDLEFEIFTKPKVFETFDEYSSSLTTICVFCKNITPIFILISKNLPEIPNIQGKTYCLHCNAEIEFNKENLYIG